MQRKIAVTHRCYVFARRHQEGQALIYGIFVLFGGLVALFFLFNTSQLVSEKAKLVNSVDAVAYSAGVMHARALNFDAYTNRALMANEVLIAQSVSIASWSKHVVPHTENVPPLMCRTYHSRPVALALLTYVPVCYLLSLPSATNVATGVDRGVQIAAQSTVASSEIAKAVLKGAQMNMAASFVQARNAVMQQVADANYADDGEVRVDPLPITDNFSAFQGEPFIRRYDGVDRTRFKAAATTAAHADGFVKERSWTSANNFPCILGTKAEFRRRGGTELNGLDEWRAIDTASLHEWRWKLRLFKLPTCDGNETPLGYGAGAASNGTASDSPTSSYGNSWRDNPRASANASSNDWSYSGLPTFYDLSPAGLAYTSTTPNPRLKFSIRLTRAKGQTRTSEGTSSVKPTGRLAGFEGKPAGGVLSAVATSEVYFERPVARSDGKTELASLFNPYWQVRLIPTSAEDIAVAQARGGAK